MNYSDMKKDIQEREDKEFLEHVSEIRREIEMMAAYGLSISQSIEILKLIELEGINYNLNGNGGSSRSVSESLDFLVDVLSDCRVKNTYGSALAITGTVDTL